VKVYTTGGEKDEKKSKKIKKIAKKWENLQFFRRWWLWAEQEWTGKNREGRTIGWN